MRFSQPILDRKNHVMQVTSIGLKMLFPWLRMIRKTIISGGGVHTTMFLTSLISPSFAGDWYLQSCPPMENKHDLEQGIASTIIAQTRTALITSKPWIL